MIQLKMFMDINDTTIDCFLYASDINESKTFQKNEFDAIHAESTTNLALITNIQNMTIYRKATQ